MELILYKCKKGFKTEEGKTIRRSEYYILRGNQLYGTRWNERYEQIDCYLCYGTLPTENLKDLEEIDYLDDYLKHEADKRRTI